MSFILFNKIKLIVGNDKVCLNFFFIIFSIIFLLDNINGSSIVSIYNPSFKFYKSNFAGSPSILLLSSLINKNIVSDSPVLFPSNKMSISFKEFTADNTSNQMLIIVESFGLINDSLKREAFQKDISVVFKSRNWKTSWGKTPFVGSTTSAELRELLNCEGDYRYFINAKHDKIFKSLFQIKKQHGYYTKAIHSYKANMFERAIWWKNIGADEVFFSEDLQIANNFQTKFNYESPFISVNDEEAFDFIQLKTASTGKQFVYFLTENSHLPFNGKLNSSIFSKSLNINDEPKLSEEAKNQIKRISNFLAYVAINLDSIKFQKILIVGDHIPPFINKEDRDFYNDQFVPYLIISR